MVSEALRVLFFTPTLGSGGAEMQVLRLLQHFDRDAVEPLLSVARPGGEYECGLPTDVSLHVCAEGVRSSLLSVAMSVPRLRHRIKQDRPHVVVSLIEHASLALRSAIAGLNRRPKLVLGIQNNFELGMAHAPWHVRSLLAPCYAANYGDADHVIALSRGVAEALEKQVPKTAHKTSVVYNAGPVEQPLSAFSQPVYARRAPGRGLIVACGRLRPQKDFSTLLRAVAAMQTQPEPELWVLGEGPERDQLVALARELGIAERVRWLGFCADPFPFFAAADVFALSSRWEGFANVLVEALACGTPVVATDCPYGPREILDDGRLGRLVPVGEPRALAAALDATLAEGKTDSIRAMCRARAKTFDPQNSAAGYTSVFRRVAAAAP